MARDTYDYEAPFNMAVATLMRLDTILQQIRHLNYNSPFDSAEKQKAYLDLVKQFYINSIPLLPENKIGRFSFLLNMQLKSKANVKNSNTKLLLRYDPSLNTRLDDTLIQLQKLMKKYFMPSGTSREGLI